MPRVNEGASVTMTPEALTDTLNVICKYKSDAGQVAQKMEKIIEMPKVSKMT